jgi:hypothetical protein
MCKEAFVGSFHMIILVRVDTPSRDLWRLWV